MKFFADFRQSNIAKQLIRSTFTIYFLVAVLVTLIQINFEFAEQKNDVLKDLISLEKTFGPTIQVSLWNLDEETLLEVIKGLKQIPFILGIEILDPNTKEVKSYGQKLIDYYKKPASERSFFNEPFKHQVEFKQEEDGKIITLGTLKLYSSNDIVISRIKYGIILLIINSIVKTAVLWVILYFFINRSLSIPLLNIKKAMELMDYNNLKSLDSKVDKSSELYSMLKSFNHLIQKLSESRDEVEEKAKEIDFVNTKLLDYKSHLEKKVKERTKELEKASEKAQEAINIKTKFLTELSDEIFTPMFSILGLTEVLKEKETDPKKIKFIEDIESSGKSLHRLFIDIFDLSKMEKGRFELDYTEVDLKEILSGLEDSYRFKMAEKGNNFKLNIDPDIPDLLLLDGVRIKQIFNNLVQHSLNTTEKGEIKVVANSFPKEVEGRVDIQVTFMDTGEGVSLYKRQSILESRIEESGNLGLALTNQLIELMHGKLKIQGEEGKGTHFEITFFNIELGNGTSSKKDTESRISDFPESKLLLFSDDYVTKKLLFAMFDGLPIQIKFAQTPEEIPEKIKKHSPDFIIIDIKQELKGLMEICEFIQGQLNSKIPIFLLSSRVGRKELKKLGTEDLPFETLISKPLSKSILLTKLNKVFEED